MSHADPLGFSALTLNSRMGFFAAGDPVNQMDPDGRLASGFGTAAKSSINSGLGFVGDFAGTLDYGLAAITGQAQSEYGLRNRDEAERFFGALSGMGDLAKLTWNAAWGDQASRDTLRQVTVAGLEGAVGANSGRSEYYQLGHTVGTATTLVLGGELMLGKLKALRLVGVGDEAAGIGTVAEGAGSRLGALTRVGENAWESSGGLRYFGLDQDGLNRVQHVLEHTAADASKPVHTVFSVPRNQVLGLVDEAWKSSARVPVQGDPGAFIVPMGRTVGTAGENAVKIIVRNGNEIVTAYPVKVP